MATYSELKEQIRILTEQAEIARKAELDAVIKEINERIAEFQLSPADLIFPSDKKVKEKSDNRKDKLPPKYRNPNPPHQTWSGRGIMPKWFADIKAEQKDNFNKENYLIEN